MDLFIRVVDGAPFEHPIFGDNFRDAFPDIDPDNLPSNFARFVRIERPVIGVYEVCDSCTYEWDGDTVTDVHHVRNMTAEEKTAKQDEAKAIWAKNGYASWVFNEETCSFEAPIARPVDEKEYRWDEATLSWIEVTE